MSRHSDEIYRLTFFFYVDSFSPIFPGFYSGSTINYWVRRDYLLSRFFVAFFLKPHEPLRSSGGNTLTLVVRPLRKPLFYVCLPLLFLIYLSSWYCSQIHISCFLHLIYSTFFPQSPALSSLFLIYEYSYFCIQLLTF